MNYIFLPPAKPCLLINFVSFRAPTATAAVQNQPVQRRASIEIQSASSSQIFGGNNSVVQEQAFKAPIQITNVISQVIKKE